MRFLLPTVLLVLFLSVPGVSADVIRKGSPICRDPQSLKDLWHASQYNRLRYNQMIDRQDCIILSKTQQIEVIGVFIGRKYPFWTHVNSLSK